MVKRRCFECAKLIDVELSKHEPEPDSHPLELMSTSVSVFYFCRECQELAEKGGEEW